MIVGSLFLLTGCSTLQNSLLLGAGGGLVLGGIIGNQSYGDHGDNVIKGALIGGATLGLASYVIHQSLEKRDQSVRRDTLMNLERYEVYGFQGVPKDQDKINGKCFSTQVVDGQKVMVPCSLLQDRAQP